jgi:integrase
MSKAKGLRQKVSGGTYYARRLVPDDLKARIGRSVWNVSTGTTDLAVARQERDRLWLQWDAEIAEAKALGAGPVATLQNVLTALDNWRRVRCAVAADFAAEIADERRALAMADMRAHIAEIGRGPVTVALADTSPKPRDPVDVDALTWARAYFASDRGLGADRGVGLPYAAGLLLDRLQAATMGGDAWAGVQGFDAKFDGAVAAGGLSASIPARVRDEARQPFARAWLEVAQHEEHERRRAASILATLEAASAVPSSIRVESAPALVPRPGDLTVGEVIAKYRAARDGEDTEKQYGHVFRALSQVLGDAKPMRGITEADILEIRSLLYEVPANATKKYPKLTLREAVERADQEEERDPDARVKRMAPNTVRSYLVNLSAVCNFAKRTLRCIDINPVEGLIPPRRNSVEREAFTPEELGIVFGGLAKERAANSAHFWVPAVLAWSGARANEISQLLVEDVKSAGETAYLDLTLFDATGRLDEDKRLKNAGSIRAVPLHPDLVSAGFLDFVERRRAEGAQRLFPELTANAVRYFSHEVSRNFARHLDRMAKVDGGEKLGDPSRTLHSLRHGFRQAGRRANLSLEVIDALGGWTARGVGANYGDSRGRGVVVENAAHMAKIAFGDFSLGASSACGGRSGRAA